MFCVIATVLAVVPHFGISRDAYGVPRVSASTIDGAWDSAGFAVAQDRAWQMEMSRHLARGTLASILGPSALGSDTEVAKTGYSTEELQLQYEQLSPFAKKAMVGYAAGVNRFFKRRGLPSEFQEHRDTPQPWTPLDSVAITIRLFQEFGKGGAGELRNLAFVQYAQSQPKLRAVILDALDDFAWQNDPAAVTTLSEEDDAVAGHPPQIFPPFNISTTEARLAEIPIPNLFELLPAVRLAEREPSHLLAQAVSAPFRTGSYCVVVSPSRSASGHALLLSGPQMGFTSPSVLHEIAIDAPGLHVSGANVPGMPGVVVGSTDRFAWGVTSGVADTEDIVWSKTAGQGYIHSGKPTNFILKRSTIFVKGKPSINVVSKWTVSGPVVLDSPSSGVVFSRHSAYRGVELRSYDALLSTYLKRNGADIDRAIAPATMNFNYFYATTGGEIGYRYAGRIPLRAPDLDPRLPTPDEAKYAWRGFVPPSQMPHVLNPKSGLLANWNNKPAAWFPNGDTPAWGRVNEANSLFEELTRAKFTVDDLALIVQKIAQKDATWPFFKEWASPFDGRLVEGSVAAARYERWMDSLRTQLIQPVAGNFLSPDIFRIVAQPTLVWNALHDKTKLAFLSNRTPEQVVAEATRIEKSSESPESGGLLPYYATGPIFKGIGIMPYSNRGTYIQIVDLVPTGPKSQSVLPPGVATKGPHAADQLPLANTWSYKPSRD